MQQDKHFRRTILALNNASVTLAERRCFWQSLEILGAVLDLLDQGHCRDPTCCNRTVARADHYLACWNLYTQKNVTLSHSLKLVDDTDLVNILRKDFPRDLLKSKMTLKCYMTRFSPTDDSCSAEYDSTFTKAVIKSNIASLLLTLNAQNDQTVQARSHLLLSLALIQLDDSLYGDHDVRTAVSTTSRPVYRSLMVLVLRCMVHTASSDNVTGEQSEISSAYYSAMVDEFFLFYDDDECLAAREGVFVYSAWPYDSLSIAPAA